MPQVVSAPVPTDSPPPAVPVTAEAETAPVRVLAPDVLLALGALLGTTFRQYKNDRTAAEQQWLANVRQVKGEYDPAVVAMLVQNNRSQAYPRITYAKIRSVVSRVMNLIFPGNERAWEVKASPNAVLEPEAVLKAVEAEMERYKENGVDTPVTDDVVAIATQRMAEQQAKLLATHIDDQLQEIGGDQSQSYETLCRAALQSGVTHGAGVLFGPMVRAIPRKAWTWNNGTPQLTDQTYYCPQFEVLSLWDFYPDMSAKTLAQSDGFFIRRVMSKSQVRALAERRGFFKEQITQFLNTNTGNFVEQAYEAELRASGAKTATNPANSGPSRGKYEAIVWYGPVDGKMLRELGAEVPDDKLADDCDAEVWLLDNVVIKADINAWRKLGTSMRLIHAFIFEEDEASPFGRGLPQIIRDSQMMVANATRMLLDNAGTVCGPVTEVNDELLAMGTDTSGVHAYKVYHREGTGADAQAPAVRVLEIPSHMPELQNIVEMGAKFADMETFVSPATGGDTQRKSSEPMRTAAGASMVRGDDALPFKDVVRQFDGLTQSFIQSVVGFNRVFNPQWTADGDYDIIARGATSLVAKEVRGVQLDTLAATMTPEERQHVDERKFIEMRFAARDLEGVLLPVEEVKRRQMAQAQQAEAQQADQKRMIDAQVRDMLAGAFKSITQGQKNSANADATAAKTTIELLQAALEKNGEQAAAPAKPAAASAEAPAPEESKIPITSLLSPDASNFAPSFNEGMPIA